MTIEDLWNKALTIDLIPIFDTLSVVVLSFFTMLVLLAVILGGIAWWSHRRNN